MTLTEFKHRYEEGKKAILAYEIFLVQTQKPHSEIAWTLPTGTKDTAPILPDLQHTLKANFWLMLYNFLEMTARNGIGAMKNAINNANLEYVELNHALRKLWIGLNESLISSPNQAGQKIDNLKLFLEHLAFRAKIRFDLTSEDYFEGNGNLAFNELEAILRSYGVWYLDPPVYINPHPKKYYNYVCGTEFLLNQNIPNTNQSCIIKQELAKIRDHRNKLLHGNKTFVASGREMGASIEILKHSAFAALDFFVDNVSFYIQNEHYKITLL